MQYLKAVLIAFNGSSVEMQYKAGFNFSAFEKIDDIIDREAALYISLDSL